MNNLLIVSLFVFLQIFLGLIYIFSLTMAYKLVKPFTRPGTLENFWLNASDILCAGSVEIINTVSLVLASWTDREQLWRRKKHTGFLYIDMTEMVSNKLWFPYHVLFLNLVFFIRIYIKCVVNQSWINKRYRRICRHREIYLLNIFTEYFKFLNRLYNITWFGAAYA